MYWESRKVHGKSTPLCLLFPLSSTFRLHSPFSFLSPSSPSRCVILSHSDIFLRFTSSPLRLSTPLPSSSFSSLTLFASLSPSPSLPSIRFPLSPLSLPLNYSLFLFKSPSVSSFLSLFYLQVPFLSLSPSSPSPFCYPSYLPYPRYSCKCTIHAH